MFKSCIKPLLCFFGILITANSVSAQSAAADSLSHKQVLYAAIVDNFYHAIGSQAMLYNGDEYQSYDPSIKNNAYFMDDDKFTLGSVFYDGFFYKDVNMMYDIYKNLVVIQLYNSVLKISLLNERVDSFDLMDHHFINIKMDSSSTNAIKSGYYDQLYGGKIQVLAHRDKSIQTVSAFSGSIESYFTGTSTNYYLYKNGTYYSLGGSEGSFLDILKDKKKDLQQFIKANKIKFKKDQREQAMAKVAAYYDQLTN